MHVCICLKSCATPVEGLTSGCQPPPDPSPLINTTPATLISLPFLHTKLTPASGPLHLLIPLVEHTPMHICKAYCLASAGSEFRCLLLGGAGLPHPPLSKIALPFNLYSLILLFFPLPQTFITSWHGITYPLYVSLLNEPNITQGILTEKVQHESGRTYIQKLTRRLKCIAWLRTTGLMDITVFGVTWSGLKFQLGKQDITTVVAVRYEEHGSNDPQHQRLYPRSHQEQI